MTANSHPIDVLVFDEQVADWRDLPAELDGGRIRITIVTAADSVRQILHRQPFHVLVLDRQTCGSSLASLLADAASLAPRVPRVVCQRNASLGDAVQVMRLGADDFLEKSGMTARSFGQFVMQVASQRGGVPDTRQSATREAESPPDVNQIVRALSHDMSANFMVLESSYKKLRQQIDQQALKQIASEARRMDACLRESKKFVQDLASLARTGTVDMNGTLINTRLAALEVLDQQRSLLEERGIVTHVADDLPNVYCNPHRFNQLLTNLIRNAARHGCDRAAPQVSIERAAAPMGTDPALAWLQVHDNGPGIPVLEREAIFRPGHRLQTAHAEGSGLGLAIVEKIVNHYRGTVFVDPSDRPGTTFVIGLPHAVPRGAPEKSRGSSGAEKVHFDVADAPSMNLDNAPNVQNVRSSAASDLT